MKETSMNRFVLTVVFVILLSTLSFAQNSQKHRLFFESSNGGTLSSTNLKANNKAFRQGARIYLSAIPDDGYEFKCWNSSKGGVFKDSVSANTVYTMPNNDTSITAVFKIPDGKSSLRIIADKGTTIPAGLDMRINGDYKKGEEISILCRNMPGYAFVKWVSTNGGAFIDSSNRSTKFIMPDNNVTIKATSKLVDFNEVLNR